MNSTYQGLYDFFQTWSTSLPHECGLTNFHEWTRLVMFYCIRLMSSHLVAFFVVLIKLQDEIPWWFSKSISRKVMIWFPTQVYDSFLIVVFYSCIDCFLLPLVALLVASWKSHYFRRYYVTHSPIDTTSSYVQTIPVIILVWLLTIILYICRWVSLATIGVGRWIEGSRLGIMLCCLSNYVPL